MKKRACIKYQLRTYKFPLIRFYIAIAAIMAMLFLSARKFFGGNEIAGSMTISSMEFATIIFLFICGMAAFKETFELWIQNGVTRKTAFISKMYSMVILGTIMAVLDRGLFWAENQVVAPYESLSIHNMFDTMYSIRYAHGAVHTIFQQIEMLLFSICLYICILTIGYFLTILFYRVSSRLKILIAVGLPVGIFIVIPMMDAMIFQGAFTNALAKAASFAFGLQHGGNPYFGMVTCLLGAALLGTGSWLLIRRATVK